MEIHSIALIKFCFYLLSIDPQATTVLVLLLLFFVIFSFMVSGAEVAFFSLTYKDISLLKTKQQPSYKRVVNLLDDPKGLLASLLIANCFANIAIIVISNILLDNIIQFEKLGIVWAGFFIKVIVVSIILVLVCEILPKIYANYNNIRFAKDFGVVVEGVYYLFKGAGNSLVKSSDFIEKKLSNRTKGQYSLEEFNQAIDITTHGTASESEKNILKGIVNFGNITVKQVMRTRLDVSGIHYDENFVNLVKKIEELHYSRLPVYKDDLDEVVGILHTKDILSCLDNSPEYDWHSLIRNAYFVHEQKMIEDLLKEFQAKRIHFAVVVDEFGGTSGIITLEDILEEIIGEIKDEFDEEDAGFKKLDEFNYIFDGRISTSEMCRLMELPTDTFDLVKGESGSLAGLVLEIAGEIPQINQIIPSGDFEFSALEIAKNRLEKIKVSIKKIQA